MKYQILISNIKRDLLRLVRRVDILSDAPDSFDSTHEARHYTERISSSDSCSGYNTDLVFCIPAVNWKSEVRIGHVRVALCLCFKTSLRTKPLLWKCVSYICSLSCKSTNFHKKNLHGDRLVWKQKQQATRQLATVPPLTTFNCCSIFQLPNITCQPIVRRFFGYEQTIEPSSWRRSNFDAMFTGKWGFSLRFRS